MSKKKIYYLKPFFRSSKCLAVSVSDKTIIPEHISHIDLVLEDTDSVQGTASEFIAGLSFPDWLHQTQSSTCMEYTGQEVLPGYWSAWMGYAVPRIFFGTVAVLHGWITLAKGLFLVTVLPRLINLEVLPGYCFALVKYAVPTVLLCNCSSQLEYAGQRVVPGNWNMLVRSSPW